MTEIRAELASVLPLQVIAHGITETFFNVYGPGWSLAINCDWSLRRHGSPIAEWDDHDDTIRQVIAGLEGRSIVTVELDEELFDPVFSFDDGTELVVQADTDLDPWVLSAEGLTVVLVGRGPGRRRNG